MNEKDAESIGKIRGIVELVIAGFVLFEKPEEQLFSTVSFRNPETGLRDGFTELKSESGIVCKLTVEGLETEEELLDAIAQVKAKAINAYIAVHNVLLDKVDPGDYPEEVKSILKEAGNNEKPENNETLIVILKDRLDELEDCETKLSALEAAGVDNWEGYDIAIDLIDDWGGQNNE
jgi:hypothetical protein